MKKQENYGSKRQMEYVERERAKGLVRVSVMVPAQDAQKIKDLAVVCRAARSTS